MAVTPLADALSPRIIARAGALCLIAGYVDIDGYTELGGVFAANMTGNSVLLVLAAARGESARAVSYLVTLAAFLAGAILASAAKRATRRPVAALVAASALVLIAALVPMAPVARLAVIATGMGLQGGAITRFGSVGLQTVVVTGTIIRLADSLVERAHPDAAEVPPWTATLEAFAWLSYIAGAAVAIGAQSAMNRPLILAAAALLAVAADVASERGAI